MVCILLPLLIILDTVYVGLIAAIKCLIRKHWPPTCAKIIFWRVMVGDSPNPSGCHWGGGGLNELKFYFGTYKTGLCLSNCDWKDIIRFRWTMYTVPLKKKPFRGTIKGQCRSKTIRGTKGTVSLEKLWDWATSRSVGVDFQVYMYCISCIWTIKDE